MYFTLYYSTIVSSPLYLKCDVEGELTVCYFSLSLTEKETLIRSVHSLYQIIVTINQKKKVRRSFELMQVSFKP